MIIVRIPEWHISEILVQKVFLQLSQVVVLKFSGLTPILLLLLQELILGLPEAKDVWIVLAWCVIRGSCISEGTSYWKLIKVRRTSVHAS